MWPMVVDGCGAGYIFQADHVANGRRWLWCMLYIPSWSCGQWSSMVVVHVIYSKLIMWPMVVDGCGACYIFQADHVANGRRWLWCMLYIPSWSCGQWSSMVVVHVIYSKLIMWPMVVDGCGACYIFQADHVANGRRWLWCMLYIPSWSCGQWSSMVVVHVIYSKLIMWPMVVDGCGACYIFQADHVANGRRWLWCMLYIPSWSCGQWSSMVVVHVIYSKLIMWPMVVDGCGACYIFQADHVANGRRWLWCMLYIPSQKIILRMFCTRDKGTKTHWNNGRYHPYANMENSFYTDRRPLKHCQVFMRLYDKFGLFLWYFMTLLEKS